MDIDEPELEGYIMLKMLNNTQMDDIGNEIGIVIGQYIKTTYSLVLATS